MLARDMQEWLRAGCTGWPGRWRLFSERTYCRGDRQMGKFGIKVLPDDDTRGAIDVHRGESGPPG